jgi:L-lactate dehydrogenase complex protein LldE
MAVGLFIPCYIDQFYPQVGMAVVEVLQRLGVEVDYPEQQTCCGQPMANSGCFSDAKPLAEHFLETFSRFEQVVCPSGSCVSMVKNHYAHVLHVAGAEAMSGKIFEFSEFIYKVLGVSELGGGFPYRVGMHQACHGLRELRLAGSSEVVAELPNIPRQLLQSLSGVTVVDLARPDECCGFGGLFSVGEESVSCQMGLDRLADHRSAGAEVVTSVDMSCLMHLDGLAKRRAMPFRVMHLAEIFAEAGR